jgi:hypothetical protein
LLAEEFNPRNTSGMPAVKFFCRLELGTVSKLSFCPIFVSAEKINPQNIQHIIPVNFFSRLELEQKF